MVWNLGGVVEGVEVFEFIYSCSMICSACTAMTIEILRSNILLSLFESFLSPIAFHIVVLFGYIMVLCRSILGTMEYYLGCISRRESHKHHARSIP